MATTDRNINKIRKFIRRTTGFDLHHYHKEKDKFSWIESLGINTIIDVGANVGQTAVDMRARFPKADIYSFEPLKECFDELNAAMKGDALFKSWNIGIGEKDETAVIHKNPYSQSSSILDMAELHRDRFPQSRGPETSETIQIKKLDNVLRASDLRKNILVKYDVQGYEDKAIRGSSEVLRNAKAVLIENSFAPLYEGQPLFADIYKILTDMGFVYRGAIWQKLDHKTGAILFEDSLFVRE